MDKPGIPRGRVFAHAPWGHLRRHLDFFLDGRLQPEIYFSAGDLAAADRSETGRAAAALAASGLACTFHAPFLDLNPGALDREVRLLTQRKFLEVLEMARIFSPRTIVFHPGYDRWRYDGNVSAWLEESLKTWPEVISAARERAPATKILLENIYETEPSSLAALLSRPELREAGFCFDTGHFQLFHEAGLEVWLEMLGGRLGEIHLHDNKGDADRHLPLGRGSFPFDRLFGELGKLNRSDLILTLEAHSREDLEQSLGYMKKHFGLEA